MGQKITQEVWNKIREEYVSSSISYRDLSSKYGINKSTIFKRAKNEGWFSQRSAMHTEVVQKADAGIVDARLKMYSKACDVSEMILNKIQQNIESFGDNPIPGTELKAYTGAIKDIREMGMFRADLDRKEQEARIRKLQKECEEENKDLNITVNFSPEMDEYAD